MGHILHAQYCSHGLTRTTLVHRTVFPPPQLCKETAHGVDSSTCVELTARRDAWQIHRADLLILFPHFPGENREVLETW